MRTQDDTANHFISAMYIHYTQNTRFVAGIPSEIITNSFQWICELSSVPILRLDILADYSSFMVRLIRFPKIPTNKATLSAVNDTCVRVQL